MSILCAVWKIFLQLNLNFRKVHFVEKKNSEYILRRPREVVSGQLFCSCCNVTLDNSRKNTIDKHLLSLNHVKKRKLQQDEEAIKAKTQASIIGAFQRQTASRDARNVAHFELVEAFSSANIPLNKLDHPKLRE